MIKTVPFPQLPEERIFTIDHNKKL